MQRQPSAPSASAAPSHWHRKKQHCALSISWPWHVPGLQLVEDEEGIDGASRAGTLFGSDTNLASVLCGPAVSEALWQAISEVTAAAGWGITVEPFASESNARTTRFWSRFGNFKPSPALRPSTRTLLAPQLVPRLRCLARRRALRLPHFLRFCAPRRDHGEGIGRSGTLHSGCPGGGDSTPLAQAAPDLGAAAFYAASSAALRAASCDRLLSLGARMRLRVPSPARRLPPAVILPWSVRSTPTPRVWRS
jgi:hypothetical protein